MAIRRSSQKRQVFAQLSQMAPPGETFLTCVHCETGPSPWLNIIFDRIPFLGLVIAFTRKFYFLTLTSTHVVLTGAGRFSNRPKGVLGSWPRDQFPISNVKFGRVWSSAYVQFAGSNKPTRLNIHRFWNGELGQLLGGTGQSTQGLPPTADTSTT